jgi:hypothetical protein
MKLNWSSQTSGDDETQLDLANSGNVETQLELTNFR